MATFTHLAPKPGAQSLADARRANAEACEIAAHELALYTINDGALYRQRAQPIIANLARKLKRGTYDAALAQKLWLYLANDGARNYRREYGGEMFGVATRKLACIEIAEHYADELAEAAQ